MMTVEQQREQLQRIKSEVYDILAAQQNLQNQFKVLDEEKAKRIQLIQQLTQELQNASQNTPINSGGTTEAGGPDGAVPEGKKTKKKDSAEAKQ